MSTTLPGLIVRSEPPAVALETTLLVHGVPRESAFGLHAELERIVRSGGSTPALAGVVGGVPIVGMNEGELRALLSAERVPKANTANLGALMHGRAHAATTVSATMELAAAAGVPVFATGGIGGVHKEYAATLDVSSDLAALARFPVAVVSSGVKSILDVPATREALEAMGVPVVGWRTDRFPAFYLRDGGAGVDWRFDELDALAGYVSRELSRTRRGVLIACPIPERDEIDRARWEAWCARAASDAAASGVSGRDVTPFILARLHELSAGQTLRANIALVKNNAALAAEIAAKM